MGVACTQGADRFYDGPYRLRVVEGAGHFVQRERPDEVIEEITRLLATPGGWARPS